ncbi:hypothetical protein D910_00372 [Dendroctonus ponderosae]|uniref:Uncharacterized protein n=1 Tax=Dendroctonus ponderosae TaxID=77166 RepID=U4UTG1_DENPD|nr:hypothetical protein D910_00372 [Dendroctonus ponderosae]
MQKKHQEAPNIPKQIPTPNFTRSLEFILKQNVENQNPRPHKSPNPRDFFPNNPKTPLGNTHLKKKNPA